MKNRDDRVLNRVCICSHVEGRREWWWSLVVVLLCGPPVKRRVSMFVAAVELIIARK